MAAVNPSNKQAPVPPLPANANLATVWAYLEKGIDQRMSAGDHSSSSAYDTYMGLATVVFDYCTHSSTNGPSGEPRSRDARGKC